MIKHKTGKTYTGEAPGPGWVIKINTLMPSHLPTTKPQPLPCCDATSPRRAPLSVSVSLAINEPNEQQQRVNHALLRVPQGALVPLPHVVSRRRRARRREASRSAAAAVQRAR